MAKKELVDNIIKLYSKLGGNMNNVLGSRSNITFLGTGKNPEPFVEMSLNMDSVAALGKSKVLKELESPMGYLTANKLNDIQATKLYNNMLQLEEFYYPKQTANITDLETGTRNLDAEGLGALKRNRPIKKAIDDNEYILKQTAEETEPLYKQQGYASVREMHETEAAMGNPISKQWLKENPVDRPPVQSAEETIKQLKIQDPDLANQVRKMVDQGIMTRGNQGAMPVKRANAREFLVEALKKDTLDPATSGFGRTNLNDIVSAEDVKFITEGGGGIGGDPLLLVEKYFGPRIVELIPDERITPRFINRLLTNVEDASGLKPDNPKFDRFTAKLIDEDIPFAEGGRAGFRLGKSVFKGIANLFTKGDDLVEQEKIFREGPITTSFLEKVNPKVTEKFKRTRDMSGPGSFGMYDNIAEMPQGLQAAEFIKNIRGPQGNVDYEKAEMFIGEGVKLTGKESVDELLQMFLNAMKSYKSPFAEGGRAGFMAGGIGRFSKAQVLIQRLKNTIKENPNDKYVQETFPGFIKEIKDNPKLAENENVFKALGGDLPSDQRFVVYSDDTVDFYKQSEGPSNIAYLERFMKKHPFLSREDALRIIKMEPEDQVLEITRLQVLNNRTKNANGGLAKILEV